MKDDDERRWRTALAALPEAEQLRVELELAQVNEMAGADALLPLVPTVRDRGLPPDTVPDGIPLASLPAARVIAACQRRFALTRGDLDTSVGA